MEMFAGRRLIVSEMALEQTAFRLFPESRHRSKRVKKKLLKRFGGEFVMKPCMFETPQGLLCHPTMYAALKQHLANQPST